MTASELAEMNNSDSIVLIRGARPMYDPKYNIKKHKNSKYLGDAGDKNNPNNFNFEMLNRQNKKDVVENLNDILNFTTLKSEDIEELVEELSNNLDLELDGMISELDDIV